MEHIIPPTEQTLASNSNPVSGSAMVNALASKMDISSTKISEQTISIGATQTVTAKLLNTYYTRDIFKGGFNICHVNGTYNNVATILFNNIAPSGGTPGTYGFAIIISYYLGWASAIYKLEAGTWILQQ